MLNILTLGNNYKHGQTGTQRTKEYIAWHNIVSRCCNPKNKAYNDYGGRGILMCDRWRNSSTLFLIDMGPAPSKNHWIERIDVNGNYEPSNCKWATTKEQGINKRNTILVKYEGSELALSDWCKKLNITYTIAHRHLANGMAFEEIVKNYHKLITFRRLNRAEILVIKAFIEEGIHPRIIARELSIAPYTIQRIARIVVAKKIAA